MKMVNKFGKIICNKITFGIVLVAIGVMLFYIPDCIVQYCDDEISLQYDTILKDVSENIKIDKEHTYLYLDSSEVLTNAENRESTYHWRENADSRFYLDETQVFLDESKSYDLGSNYDCEKYVFTYENAEYEIGKGRSAEYYVLDENGKNSNGEIFSADKCLNDNAKYYTDIAISNRKRQFRESCGWLNAFIYIGSALMIMYGGFSSGKDIAEKVTKRRKRGDM